MGVRGWSYLENVFDYTLLLLGERLLDIVIRPFLDRRGSCNCYFNVTFQCIDFIVDLSVSRAPTFSSMGGGGHPIAFPMAMPLLFFSNRRVKWSKRPLKESVSAHLCFKLRKL